MDCLIDRLIDRPTERANESISITKAQRVCSVCVCVLCAVCVCVCEVQQFEVHTWVAPRLMPSINLRMPVCVCVHVCAKVTSFNSFLAPFTATFNWMANRSRLKLNGNLLSTFSCHNSNNNNSNRTTHCSRRQLNQDVSRNRFASIINRCAPQKLHKVPVELGGGKGDKVKQQTES